MKTVKEAITELYESDDKWLEDVRRIESPNVSHETIGRIRMYLQARHILEGSVPAGFNELPQNENFTVRPGDANKLNGNRLGLSALVHFSESRKSLLTALSNTFRDKMGRHGRHHAWGCTEPEMMRFVHEYFDYIFPDSAKVAHKIEAIRGNMVVSEKAKTPFVCIGAYGRVPLIGTRPNLDYRHIGKLVHEFAHALHFMFCQEQGGPAESDPDYLSAESTALAVEQDFLRWLLNFNSGGFSTRSAMYLLWEFGLFATSSTNDMFITGAHIIGTCMSLTPDEMMAVAMKPTHADPNNMAPGQVDGGQDIFFDALEEIAGLEPNTKNHVR